MHKLSRLRVIHRDLKAGNILLDWEMKLRFQILGLQKYSAQIMLNETLHKEWSAHSKFQETKPLAGIYITSQQYAKIILTCIINHF